MDFDYQTETINIDQGTVLTINGTGGVIIPTGTTAQETGTTNGTLRYNTDLTATRMRDNGTWKSVGTVRTFNFTPPASGITLGGSGPDSAGVMSITMALADDLLAVENLATTGLAVRTATNTWTTRTLQSASLNILVGNGDGVSGNPNIDIDDTVVSTYGLDTWKLPARVGTTANVTLVGGAPNTLDGVTLAAGNRILVKNQTASAENGIYVVTTLGTGVNGTWTRSSDANTSAKVTANLAIYISEGTTLADTLWYISSNAPIVLGTSPISIVPTVIIVGASGTNQLRVGPAFTATNANAATVYIETNVADQDGQLVYFNSGTPGTSGYISYAYDASTPYLRVTDSDDDPPYITFNTIGTGTYAAPLYVSAFGARGTYASRTAGAEAGFAWYIGANTSANALITAATPVMELDSTWLRLPNGTTATRPATAEAGQIRLNTDSGSGLETFTETQWNMIQNNLGSVHAIQIGPSTGTAFSVVNTSVAVSAGNTVIANPTITSASAISSARRVTLTTGAVAGGVAYVRTGAVECWRGNAAGLGGFTFIARFGLETLQTNLRAFVGLADSIANPTNINPLTNTTPGRIGMAININTGNWNIINNVTGTAPTVTALGANFPVNTTNLYELVIYSPPNGTTIFYRVTSQAGNVASGSFTTNIPSSTTFLGPQAWVTNNAIAGSAVMGIARMYLETNL